MSEDWKDWDKDTKIFCNYNMLYAIHCKECKVFESKGRYFYACCICLNGWCDKCFIGPIEYCLIGIQGDIIYIETCLNCVNILHNKNFAKTLNETETIFTNRISDDCFDVFKKDDIKILYNRLFDKIQEQQDIITHYKYKPSCEYCKSDSGEGYKEAKDHFNENKY